MQARLVTQNRSDARTLGRIISALRLSRTHPLTGRLWSQEELAFAIGSGQAHISRIESGEKIPQYSTLILICDALKLSPSERAYLLSSGGYYINSSLPDKKSVQRVLSELVPFLDSCPYPATLVDEGERIWYLNPLAVAIWGSWAFGSCDYMECNRLMYGQRYVQLIFDPGVDNTRLPVWKQYYEHPDNCLDRAVALFWRACHLHLDDLEMDELAKRLKTNSDFAGRWERIDRGDRNLLFLEHSLYTLRHPELGCLRYNAWRTRFMSDERFIVTHCTPIDHSTSDAFERLNRKPLNRKAKRIS